MLLLYVVLYAFDSSKILYFSPVNYYNRFGQYFIWSEGRHNGFNYCDDILLYIYILDAFPQHNVNMTIVIKSGFI